MLKTIGFIPTWVLSLAFLLCAVPAIAQPPVWPGQPSNPVGYAAAPGWTGSFNSTACPSSPASGSSWATATIVRNCTYNAGTGTNVVSCNYCEFLQVDFIAGAGAQMKGNNVLFLGCRFQSNDTVANNVSDGDGTGTGLFQYYFYDSFVPYTSFATSPPGSLWPSAGAGTNSMTITSGVNAIAGNQAYQFGITFTNSSGPAWIDHCDFWGFANAIDWLVTTAQFTLTNNWVHDPREPVTFTDHTDGPGYLNGSTAPNNVTMIGNTVALLGNTQALALQAATGGYQNIYVAENLWSGDGGTISFCPTLFTVACTNSYFYGNTFATDVRTGGPTYGPQFSLGTGTVWACNTISFRSGTTWSDGNDNWAPTSAMNGQYFVIPTGSSPNLSYNGATDTSFGLATNSFCGIPVPSSVNFGNQSVNASSAGQTITFSSTNSGNLSISSIALATGTQFSISSNTCGSTLTSGSSCSITVKFSPTAMGPQTDTLKITDNTSGVTSPQLVPLAGIGTTASVIFSSPSTILPALVFNRNANSINN